MNMNKELIVAAAAVAAQMLCTHSSRAQETFPAFVAAVAISTNQAGDLTYQRFGNWTLIRQCAAEQGLTNLMGLHLVYDLHSDALQVASGDGTNQTVVCTPLTFSTGVFLSNTNHTKSERLSGVYWETNTVASGTVTATERYWYGTSNQLAGFSLIGQLQFALPASGTNGPTIIHGSIVAGSRLFGEDDFGGDQPRFDNPDANSQGSEQGDFGRQHGD